MKHVKLLSFLVAIVFVSLVLVACAPMGSTLTVGWSGPTFVNGMVYVGSTEGKILAVNASARGKGLDFPSAADGEWVYSTPVSSGSWMSCAQSTSGVTIYGTPVVVPDENLVYIGAYNGKVYALDMGTGVERWEYPKGEGNIGAVVGSPVVSDGSLYVSSSDGRIYSLNLTYGDKKWQSVVLGDKLWSTPAFGNGVIYVSTFDGYIYGLPATGVFSQEDVEASWSYYAESGFVSSPVVYNGTVFCSFGNNLYAVREGSNSTAWNFSGGKWFWAPPLVRGGVVYAGCLDNYIYAIDSQTGAEIWSYDTGSRIVSAPVLAGDYLVVVSEDGDLFVFDLASPPDGESVQPVKVVPVTGDIQSPLCFHNGVIYLRSQDNYLQAIDIGEGRVVWKLPLTGK